MGAGIELNQSQLKYHTRYRVFSVLKIKNLENPIIEDSEQQTAQGYTLCIRKIHKA